MSSFEIRKIAVLLGLTCSIGTSAAATCYVCDEVIEVTDTYAQCFIDNYDTLILALKTAPGGRQQVNFGGCNERGSDAKNRGGLIGFGELPPPPPNSIKSVYILDEASAVCLYKLISTYEGSFDPKAVFDLVLACEDE